MRVVFVKDFLNSCESIITSDRHTRCMGKQNKVPMTRERASAIQSAADKAAAQGKDTSSKLEGFKERAQSSAARNSESD